MAKTLNTQPYIRHGKPWWHASPNVVKWARKCYHRRNRKYQKELIAGRPGKERTVLVYNSEVKRRCS